MSTNTLVNENLNNNNNNNNNNSTSTTATTLNSDGPIAHLDHM